MEDTSSKSQVETIHSEGIINTSCLKTDPIVSENEHLSKTEFFSDTLIDYKSITKDRDKTVSDNESDFLKDLNEKIDLVEEEEYCKNSTESNNGEFLSINDENTQSEEGSGKVQLELCENDIDEEKLHQNHKNVEIEESSNLTDDSLLDDLTKNEKNKMEVDKDDFDMDVDSCSKDTDNQKMEVDSNVEEMDVDVNSRDTELSQQLEKECGELERHIVDMEKPSLNVPNEETDMLKEEEEAIADTNATTCLSSYKEELEEGNIECHNLVGAAVKEESDQENLETVQSFVEKIDSIEIKNVTPAESNLEHESVHIEQNSDKTIDTGIQESQEKQLELEEREITQLEEEETRNELKPATNADLNMFEEVEGARKSIVDESDVHALDEHKAADGACLQVFDNKSLEVPEVDLKTDNENVKVADQVNLLEDGPFWRLSLTVDKITDLSSDETQTDDVKEIIHPNGELTVCEQKSIDSVLCDPGPTLKEVEQKTNLDSTESAPFVKNHIDINFSMESDSNPVCVQKSVDCFLDKTESSEHVQEKIESTNFYLPNEEKGVQLNGENDLSSINCEDKNESVIVGTSAESNVVDCRQEVTEEDRDIREVIEEHQTKTSVEEEKNIEEMKHVMTTEDVEDENTLMEEQCLAENEFDVNIQTNEVEETRSQNIENLQSNDTMATSSHILKEETVTGDLGNESSETDKKEETSSTKDITVLKSKVEEATTVSSNDQQSENEICIKTHDLTSAKINVHEQSALDVICESDINKTSSSPLILSPNLPQTHTSDMPIVGDAKETVSSDENCKIEISEVKEGIGAGSNNLERVKSLEDDVKAEDMEVVDSEVLEGSKECEVKDIEEGTSQICSVNLDSKEEMDVDVDEQKDTLIVGEVESVYSEAILSEKGVDSEKDEELNLVDEEMLLNEDEGTYESKHILDKQDNVESYQVPVEEKQDTNKKLEEEIVMSSIEKFINNQDECKDLRSKEELSTTVENKEHIDVSSEAVPESSSRLVPLEKTGSKIDNVEVESKEPASIPSEALSQSNFESTPVPVDSLSCILDQVVDPETVCEETTATKDQIGDVQTEVEEVTSTSLKTGAVNHESSESTTGLVDSVEYITNKVDNNDIETVSEEENTSNHENSENKPVSVEDTADEGEDAQLYKDNLSASQESRDENNESMLVSVDSAESVTDKKEVMTTLQEVTFTSEITESKIGSFESSDTLTDHQILHEDTAINSQETTASKSVPVSEVYTTNVANDQIDDKETAETSQERTTCQEKHAEIPLTVGSLENITDKADYAETDTEKTSQETRKFNHESDECMLASLDSSEGSTDNKDTVATISETAEYKIESNESAPISLDSTEITLNKVDNEQVESKEVEEISQKATALDCENNESIPISVDTVECSFGTEYEAQTDTKEVAEPTRESYENTTVMMDFTEGEIHDVESDKEDIIPTSKVTSLNHENIAGSEDSMEFATTKLVGEETENMETENISQENSDVLELDQKSSECEKDNVESLEICPDTEKAEKTDLVLVMSSDTSLEPILEVDLEKSQLTIDKVVNESKPTEEERLDVQKTGVPILENDGYVQEENLGESEDNTRQGNKDLSQQEKSITLETQPIIAEEKTEILPKLLETDAGMDIQVESLLHSTEVDAKQVTDDEKSNVSEVLDIKENLTLLEEVNVIRPTLDSGSENEKLSNEKLPMSDVNDELVKEVPEMDSNKLKVLNKNLVEDKKDDEDKSQELSDEKVEKLSNSNMSDLLLEEIESGSHECSANDEGVVSIDITKTCDSVPENIEETSSLADNFKVVSEEQSDDNIETNLPAITEPSAEEIKVNLGNDFELESVETSQTQDISLDHVKSDEIGEVESKELLQPVNSQEEESNASKELTELSSVNAEENIEGNEHLSKENSQVEESGKEVLEEAMEVDDIDENKLLSEDAAEEAMDVDIDENILNEEETIKEALLEPEKVNDASEESVSNKVDLKETGVKESMPPVHQTSIIESLEEELLNETDKNEADVDLNEEIEDLLLDETDKEEEQLVKNDETSIKQDKDIAEIEADVLSKEKATEESSKESYTEHEVVKALIEDVLNEIISNISIENGPAANLMLENSDTLIEANKISEMDDSVMPTEEEDTDSKSDMQVENVPRAVDIATEILHDVINEIQNKMEDMSQVCLPVECSEDSDLSDPEAIAQNIMMSLAEDTVPTFETNKTTKAKKIISEIPIESESSAQLAKGILDEVITDVFQSVEKEVLAEESHQKEEILEDESHENIVKCVIDKLLEDIVNPAEEKGREPEETEMDMSLPEGQFVATIILNQLIADIISQCDPVQTTDFGSSILVATTIEPHDFENMGSTDTDDDNEDHDELLPEYEESSILRLSELAQRAVQSAAEEIMTTAVETRLEAPPEEEASPETDSLLNKQPCAIPIRNIKQEKIADISMHIKEEMLDYHDDMFEDEEVIDRKPILPPPDALIAKAKVGRKRKTVTQKVVVPKTKRKRESSSSSRTSEKRKVAPSPPKRKKVPEPKPPPKSKPPLAAKLKPKPKPKAKQAPPPPPPPPLPPPVKKKVLSSTRSVGRPKKMVVVKKVSSVKQTSPSKVLPVKPSTSKPVAKVLPTRVPSSKSAVTKSTPSLAPSPSSKPPVKITPPLKKSGSLRNIVVKKPVTVSPPKKKPFPGFHSSIHTRPITRRSAPAFVKPSTPEVPSPGLLTRKRTRLSSPAIQSVEKKPKSEEKREPKLEAPVEPAKVSAMEKKQKKIIPPDPPLSRNVARKSTTPRFGAPYKSSREETNRVLVRGRIPKRRNVAKKSTTQIYKRKEPEPQPIYGVFVDTNFGGQNMDMFINENDDSDDGMNPYPKPKSLKRKYNYDDYYSRWSPEPGPSTHTSSGDTNMVNCAVKIKRIPILDQLFPSKKSPQKLEPNICELCDPKRIFLSKSALTQHINEDHINKYLDPLIRDSQSPPVSLPGDLTISISENTDTCIGCQRKFHSKNRLIEHIKTCKQVLEMPAKNNEIDLSNISKSVSISRTTSEKKTEELDVPMSHVCKVCNKKFLMPAGLTAHMKTHRTIPKSSRSGKLNNLKCHICSAKFKHGSELVGHMSVHSLTSEKVNDVILKSLSKIEGIEVRVEKKVVDVGSDEDNDDFDDHFELEEDLEDEPNVLYVRKDQKSTKSALNMPLKKIVHSKMDILDSNKGKDSVSEYLNKIISKNNVSITTNKLVSKPEVIDITDKEESNMSSIAPKKTKIMCRKEEVSGPGKCNECGRLFTIRSIYEKHISFIQKISTLEDQTKCPVCDLEIKLKCKLGAHVDSHRPKSDDVEEALMCKKCNKVFRCENNLIRHELEHEGMLRVNCQNCGDTFKSVSELNVHQEECKFKNREFRCEVCGKLFSAKWRLDLHMRTDEKHGTERVAPTTYYCDQCGKDFKGMSALKKHIDSKCGTEPIFECVSCDKKYFSPGSLAAHKRTHHTTEKNYICQYCSKDFITKNQLDRHELRHTPQVRPYYCKYANCDKAYRQADSLRAHECEHTGIYPYTCEFCFLQFSNVKSLKMHRKSTNHWSDLEPNKVVTQACRRRISVGQDAKAPAWGSHKRKENVREVQDEPKNLVINESQPSYNESYQQDQRLVTSFQVHASQYTTLQPFSVNHLIQTNQQTAVVVQPVHPQPLTAYSQVLENYFVMAAHQEPTATHHIME